MKNTVYLFILTIALTACDSKSKKEEISTIEEIPEVVEEPKSHAVYAKAQTHAVRSLNGEDAADDPAFWFNSSAPKNSLIIGSNKREGIEVYKLSGERIAYYPTGRINNVDVAQKVALGVQGALIDIAAGSNRTYNRIDIWSIDSTGKKFDLISDTTMRAKLQEVYGFCLYRESEKDVYAIVNGKSGKVEQYKLWRSELGVGFELVGEFAAPSQTEGSVIDTIANKFYLGVEELGILIYDIVDGQMKEGKLIPLSGEDNEDLMFDIEGLCIHYASKTERYLFASSQGNNRYAVFDISKEPEYLDYFTIEAQNGIDGTSETDGIDIFSGNLGSDYPKGIFMVQDGYNTNIEGDTLTQNFKMVSVEEIMNVIKN
jgi:3-phytase